MANGSLRNGLPDRLDVIGCRLVIASSGRVAGDRWVACAGVVGRLWGWCGGLGSAEELVHDLGATQMTRSGLCWFAWSLSRKALAAARWRNPVTVRAADAAMLEAIASLVAGDDERGRRVTGSMAVPRTQQMPIPAQTAPVSACGRVRWDRAAAMTAAAGIGQGAATPAPQPTSSPAGTDKGMLMPQGWPGRSSRIATALPRTAAPANASDVASSARSGSALIRCSCLPVLRGKSKIARPLVGDAAPSGR
jgi:hypothetical protein